MDEFTQKQLNLSQPTLDQLSKLHLNSLSDIVLHLPLRYEDETKLSTIDQATIGTCILIEGTIIKQIVKYSPRKQLLLQINDTQNNIFFIRLFNFYPNQLRLYTENTKIRAFGELKKGFYGLEMIHPKIKTQFSDQLDPYLTPIYPTVSGLGQNTLRTIIRNALNIANLEDFLPDHLLKKNQLIDFKSAVFAIHYPPSNHYDNNELLNAYNPALKRLKFDELLAQQLSMGLMKARRNETKKYKLHFENKLVNALLQSLPFELTNAQKKVLDEIENDLKQSYPMHRLLQGDVGSGKTIVAALTALKVIESGYQTAIIAPTELLAEQHLTQFKKWFEPLCIRVAWLSGSQNKNQKEKVKQDILQGNYNIVIGTHALIQENVLFKNLELIIIDEQHRFGVNQRLLLKQKGKEVHQLMMSATPIPRTLSMTYFADVDISTLDELPPNRAPVKTILVSESRKKEIENFVYQKIKQGRQVYWVCPLIEESEVLQLTTAIETYDTLKKKFTDINIGLVHGRLKSDEKVKIMSSFKENQIQLLVATTVIEVGINVPNASTMIIEHSERMGLSQLHQLRGRVGRGENINGECILIYKTPLSDVEKLRLKVIYESNDGFEIAKQDLIIRGPGEFLGAKQSGIPLLRFANVNEDCDLSELAKCTAAYLLKTSPDIVEKHLNRWLSNKETYLGV
ncbi:MAG: ATP-dependent DNA helicase RecG [Neisseriaceae bacterium]|nr:MAG: ATP-dependent DNA helicase RecG [Neisseriaceae bacterium]